MVDPSLNTARLSGGSFRQPPSGIAAASGALAHPGMSGLVYLSSLSSTDIAGEGAVFTFSRPREVETQANIQQFDGGWGDDPETTADQT